jgi:CheY-like chemotaxis protein
MATVLKDAGHTVHIAGDIPAALELASRESFDLLLSDLGLPSGTGVDLMKELRARGCTFPGIALTGYGQESDIRRTREAGFAFHLTKPGSPESLFHAIASVTSNA